ncbi:MAG TPA: hypothetical protein PK358_06560 [Spirochaetota bacterium]|nr:hypothetical protein [Spirochaetota bacterium]
MKKFSDIKVVIYNDDCLGYTIGQRIVNSSKKLGKEIITYRDETELGIILEDAKTKFLSKEVLILKIFLGRKFQKCPGSNNVICCNYYLLNTCFNCLYDCTYCFLNSYLNSYGIVQFVNLDELAELVNTFSQSHKNLLRVGTGEFTDSLMFDEVTGIAEQLISDTCNNNRLFLEFKTKSANVDHLLQIKEKGNTVLAWTLNTERNISLYETGAASLIERLEAASKAQNAGYLTAFHFDPVIKYKNFMDDYYKTIEMMRKYINPEGVIWISLGCFRYSPGFKDIIKHKYPAELMTVEEMFPGVDGKLRYITKERIEIFKNFSDKLKSYYPETFIYLCMEDSYVWKEVFGADYSESEELERDLSEHLKNYINKPLW